MSERDSPFWANVLRSLGAEPLVARRELPGASGEVHRFRALGVDTRRGMMLAVLVDTDERHAALAHHDVSAAAAMPVLFIRPVAVDFGRLMELFHELGDGTGRAFWQAFSALGGTRISRKAARALLRGWTEVIARDPIDFPVLPTERLGEVLRETGRLRVSVGPDGFPRIDPDGGGADGRPREGIWDFPLHLLTDSEIRRIADATGPADDAVVRRILRRHRIRLELEGGPGSSTGLILNRHREAAAP